MDFNLSEDQLAYQEAARAFAEGELMPNAAAWDESKHFPVDVIAKAGEMGFCAMYSPGAIGGMDMQRTDAAIVLEELARGCTATAAFISIHNMALWMIANWGSEQAVAELCPKLVTGERLLSYCLTEPNAGSDAASLRTSAKLDGEHYVLNGGKMFISGAGSTQVLVVMARTGSQDDGARGISAFIVPADAEGVSYGKNEPKLGWNAQPTAAISFENVRIPAHYRLGKEGEGFKFAMMGLDGGRINIATTAVGTAQAALEASSRYMNERSQFGKTLANFQALQFKLADMATELVAARQMVRLAAFKLDQGDPDKTTYCAMAKQFATDISFKVCNEAMQIHGGYGYLREYPLERYVRDSRVHQILEGTNEVMRMLVSRRILQDGATEIIR
ncbi:MAG: acyl-CoA dehydrogenase family protein [Cellvibrionaceae bacterium]|nr:acyl-CoA dehydrogenase family protein [Cellvibrionaceae bacterium]MCV6626363.1 acyl-CoA dehydrogenase family protein [Cellvibrionaceae bacterium]